MLFSRWWFLYYVCWGSLLFGVFDGEMWVEATSGVLMVNGGNGGALK